MIPLKQFLCEGSGIRATEAWMRKKFKEFNETLFDNQLPYCDLRCEKLNGRFLGYFKFQEDVTCYRRAGGRRYYMYLKNSNKKITDISIARPLIILNSDGTFRDELAMESTMIHEMIHFYTYKDCIAPPMAHGKEFKHMCEYLKARGERVYGKKFNLSVYADQGNYTESDDEIRKERDKIMRLGMSVILVEVKGTKFPSRVIFVRPKKVDSMIEEIKALHKDYAPIEKICVVRDLTKVVPVDTIKMFSLSNKYGKFYLPDDIKDFADDLLVSPEFETVYDIKKEVYEGRLKDFFKKVKDAIVRLIFPNDTNLSLYGIEEVGKIEQTEDI